MSLKLAFISAKDELTGPFLERMKALYPELPLWVVAEFPPPEGKWIPYKPNRSFRENYQRVKAAIAGRRIRLSAVVLDPHTPYWRMRWIAFLISPAGFMAFNENLDHFMLRPRSAGTILRHLVWRLKNFLRWQLRPGGAVYTWVWRLAHPKQLRRPFAYRLAIVAGWCAAHVRAMLAPRRDPQPCAKPEGISVIIPSRNGRQLLERLLPAVLADLPLEAEVIVVDNGSEDGTSAWLAETYPQVGCLVSQSPLSFAAAANAGVRAAHYAYVCLLNNDMVIEPGFFAALRRAFDHTPELFAATAQIFFPEGMRRQETGKAVYYSEQAGRRVRDFPVRCLEPFEGEDGSYVLYGSGGCTMYQASKLEALGGFEEMLAPAYVEDLDLGWRAWQRNWPTIYVAEARVVHYHRGTTSRYYQPDLLQSFIEYNYLRFLARHVASPEVFSRLWRAAVDRLNLLAAEQPWYKTWALEALAYAWKATRLLVRPPAGLWPEEWILAIGSGDVAVFPARAKRGKPCILVVSPYVPYPLSHGGAVRIFNLMRQAAADYDQVLVAFSDELAPAPAELLALCVEVVLVKRHGTHLVADRSRPDTVEEFFSTAMQAALRQTVRKWRPEVAQLEFTWMAQYAGDCAPARTILVEHDITFDLYEQLLRQGDDWEIRRQYERWQRFERQAWRQVDAVVTMSEKDRAAVGAHAVVLPNGVDLERFEPSPSPPDAARILFIGSFAHLPNILAVDFFLREVWPLIAGLEPVFHIIAGSRHRYYLERYRDQAKLDLEQPRIEVEDFVADVRPAYRRATLVVAPLVASAGTNIKIMEAMAMGKAVVSTPAGINGLDLTDGRDVLVAADGPSMAAAIRHLIENPDRRVCLERQARARVEADFDWRAIGARQRDLYERLRASTGCGDRLQPNCSPAAR